MTELNALLQKVTVRVSELRSEYEGAPVQVHQIETGREAANLATIEEAIMHFNAEKKKNLGLPSAWADRETALLQKSRRRLVLEAAARLLAYWLVLGEEEKDGDGEGS